MLSPIVNTMRTYQSSSNMITPSYNSILHTTRMYQINNTQAPLKFIPKILIQTIPIDDNELDPYDLIEEYTIDGLTKVTTPNALSQIDNDPQTFKVINNVSKMTNLPVFVYQRDSTTGFLKRYLVTERDTSYDTDLNYGMDQQWLLNNRQGDQYDRLHEWISDPVIADAEDQNMFGVTTLNEGRIWGGPPKLPTPYKSAYYDEYQQYLEYGQTQVEEESD